VFDTLQSTRKAVNLSQNPRIAFVFGGWGAGEERCVSTTVRQPLLAFSEPPRAPRPALAAWS
jgi:hypothetical protein